MILLFDAGNTRTKWRLMSESRIITETGVLMNKDLTANVLTEEFKGKGVDKIICSVVGGDEIEREIYEFGLNFQIEVRSVKSKKKIGRLTFVYEDYKKMGVDRAMAMLGAFEDEAVLVIDAGSAVTADYVDSGGHHLGGYIFPGYAMLRSVLLGKTAEIGNFDGFGNHQLGVSTETCVNNGFVVMYLGMLQELSKKAKGFEIEKIIVTGGDAIFLKTCAGVSMQIKENLVLDGLEKIAFKKGVI